MTRLVAVVMEGMARGMMEGSHVHSRCDALHYIGIIGVRAGGVWTLREGIPGPIRRQPVA